MSFGYADLHCDLLSYLAKDKSRSVEDSASRCSLPLLKKGNVFYQTFAIFTETHDSAPFIAEKQLNIFLDLLKLYSNDFISLKNTYFYPTHQKIKVAIAIENASGLCAENEPITKCINRLENFLHLASPIIYISLTWNHENRFGGGNLTSIGLKVDGEFLLDHLDGRGIAVDLSHASDALAYGILHYIEKKGLRILPIASHSNFRSVCYHSRNLSDELAKEIVWRGGIIGLNLFKHFLGDRGFLDMVRHLEYASQLDILENYCLGSDFFYDEIHPCSLYSHPYFHTQFEDSSCYPSMFSKLKEIFDSQMLENFSYQNIIAFFERLGLGKK